MDSFWSIRRNLQTFSLLLVFPLMFQEKPTVVAGSTTESVEAKDPQVYADHDSYRIYAALLENEKHSMYVIQAEIRGHPGLTKNRLGIKGDSEFMREWGMVMDDYAKQNRTGKLLKMSFPLHIPYELVPEASIFSNEHGQKGWDDFYHRYPSSGGYYWFSAVGFNFERTRAIVSMGRGCGLLCGGAEHHFFQKRDGKWREVSVKATVSVGAS